MNVKQVHETAKLWDEELDRFIKSLNVSSFTDEQIGFINAMTERLDGQVLLGCESIASLMEEAVRDEYEN